MQSNVVKLVVVAIMMSTFTGCALFGKKDTTSSKTDDGQTQGSVETSGIGESGTLSGTALEEQAKKTKNVFYFDFDKSIVKDEDQTVLQTHAQYLAESSSKNAHIIGHTDERGTPEYNLALGERRAKAIAEVLQTQGTKNGQLTITSYGEEAPAAEGHDESAWALNRRAEVMY